MWIQILKLILFILFLDPSFFPMNIEVACVYMYTESKFQSPGGVAEEAQFTFTGRKKIDKRKFLHIKIAYLANNSQLDTGIKQIIKSFLNVQATQ